MSRCLVRSGPRVPRRRPQERRQPQRNLDPARFNPRTLPVLDDADEEAMMDDIVGVVVDEPRYATERPRRR